MSMSEEAEMQDRQNLSQELDGLGGLVYRVAATFAPEGLHAAALSVVCEALYLARQVMAQDKVDRPAVDHLLSAISDLEKKGVEWKIGGLQAQIGPQLPEHLRPAAGPTRTALDFALHEWLSRTEVEGKTVEQLAGEFSAFCEVAPPPAQFPPRR